ncbi:MAG: RNA-binding protein [Alphaproteobacteria bacterium]
MGSDVERRDKAPQRTCIVTRVTRPVSDLIRFVAAPDGTAAPDLRRRLPGRGAWVTADRRQVEIAVTSRRLQRVLELAEPVDPALVEQLEALLVEAAVAALSLARKAGEVISGFVKVAAALDKGTVSALIHADDAADDGQKKLAAAARRSGRDTLPVIRSFSRDHLDLAFGRTNVIHAALLAGRAGDNVLARVADLARYRDGLDPDTGSRTPIEDAGRVDDAALGQ